MTLEEYEKVLEEKRKTLEAAKASERKVEVDKAFEKMQLVDNKKREEDIFIKLVRGMGCCALCSVALLDACWTWRGTCSVQRVLICGCVVYAGSGQGEGEEGGRRERGEVPKGEMWCIVWLQLVGGVVVR